MPVIDTDAAILTALLAAGCVPRHAAGSAIDVAVDEKKRLSHIVDSLDLLLYVCLLILTIVTVWILKNRRFRFLHESGLAIFYGLVVGMLLRLLGSDTRPVSHMLVEPHRAEGQQTRAVAAGMFTDSPPDTLLLSVNVSAPESREGSRADEYITEAGGGGEKLFAYKFEVSVRCFFFVLLPRLLIRLIVLHCLSNGIFSKEELAQLLRRDGIYFKTCRSLNLVSLAQKSYDSAIVLLLYLRGSQFIRSFQ